MRAFARVAVGCAVWSLSAPASVAQEYPSRPVRMVIPWPAGGITDVISRGLAAVLTEAFGQHFVVDNRPGAAGTLGVGIVAKAAPDGYTLMMSDVPSHAISATLYAKLPYDALKDIEPVALPSRSPMVVVINPKLGVTSLARLIETAKARPGQLAYGSSGNGSITHLTAERFKRDTGIDLLHVAYKGSGPMTTAIVGGESALGFACIAPALPHIKAQRLTLLAVTSAKRSPVFPDIPAVAETIKGFDLGCNTGFFAPGRTPQPIVARLHTEIMKAVENPKIKALLATNSAEAAPFTQAQFKAHVAQEVRDWGEVVRAVGVKAQ